MYVNATKNFGILAACWALSSCAPEQSVSLQNNFSASSNRTSPSPPPGSSPQRSRSLRTNGTVQALESYSVRVPQISGQSSRVTLTTLIPNGSRVAAGQVVAEFDRTSILDEVLATEAKLAETAHQLSEKQAQIRSDRAKREATIAEATAELKKAQLQLRKGPILSEIDRLKNEAKARSATDKLASLEKSGSFRAQAEQAALRGLELKRQRQQVTLERLKSN